MSIETHQRHEDDHGNITNVYVTVVLPEDPRIAAIQRDVRSLLRRTAQIARQEHEDMTAVTEAFAELQATVADEINTDESVVITLNGLADKIDALVAAGTDTVPVEDIQALTSQIRASATGLAEAATSAGTRLDPVTDPGDGGGDTPPTEEG